jgi:hypothetical protein
MEYATCGGLVVDSKPISDDFTGLTLKPGNMVL